MDGPPSLRLGASATGQRISYDATSDVQMQVHLHRRRPNLREGPRNGARGIASCNLQTPERDPVGWRSAAEEDEPWIWCLATCCPHSCRPRNGGRVVTAIPVVTAWKWPGCPESRWPCATPTAPMGLHCYLPGPRGSASCAACARARPS